MKLLLLLLVVSCTQQAELPSVPSRWSKPYQKCLRTEHYTYVTPMMIGKVMTMITHTGERCVEHSVDYFIDEMNGKTYKLVEEIK